MRGSNFIECSKRESQNNMLISGFIDGRLVYTLGFPFNSDSLVEVLKTQLIKKFPDGDISGQYLRSANLGETLEQLKKHVVTKTFKE